ncbi:MAG: ABC transporter substrate-binding protein, partial [Deferribacteres bacterium]|nr:ABC transporter substrate-binding protein [Deferribacteres bacterium]
MSLRRQTAACPAFILVIGLILLLPAASAGAARTLDRVTLQLKWRHQFQFAGYYAAVEKGYYREAGLEVILKEGRRGMNFVDEVVSGRADFGTEMPVLLLKRLQGRPVVVLAAVFQHSPEILVARKDSGIKTPQDLVGRRVEMRSDGGIESRAMFLDEGISLNDIRIVEHSWGIDDLINGKVDASEGYITDRPFMLRERGVPYVIIRPLTYGIDFYGDCLFTSEKQIKEHPQRVKAFREASLRGWNYAMKHPDEIIDIILNKYNPRLSREFLRFEAAATRKLMLPNVIEIGHMNPGRWRHIADTYVRLGMVSPEYSLKGFLYDPDSGADYTWLRWTLGITLSALVLIGAGFVSLFIFNKKLHKAVRERSAELSKLNKELVSEIAERRQTEEELERHRLHLEELVRERTKELEAKTENLKRSEQTLIYLLEDVNEIRADLEKANEKLKELDRLKSMFIASMSHELRTPLNSIIGFTGLVLQGMAGEINEEQRDQLQRVYASAKHLLLLITDVIDISKIEVGEIEVFVEEFRLEEIFEEAVSSLRTQIDDKGLDVEVDVSPDIRLRTDSRRLLQCILNYLSNAVKFTEKGRVRISAR